MECGHQEVTYLFWPENKNLLPEGPQNTAMSSPSKEVRKTSGENLVVRSVTISPEFLFERPRHRTEFHR